MADPQASNNQPFVVWPKGWIMFLTKGPTRPQPNIHVVAKLWETVWQRHVMIYHQIIVLLYGWIGLHGILMSRQELHLKESCLGNCNQQLVEAPVIKEHSLSTIHKGTWISHQSHESENNFCLTTNLFSLFQ